MDVIEIAKELALAVQKDARYEALAAARHLNDIDQELQEQIGRFNLARIDLNAMLNAPEKDNAKVKEQEDSINALYAEIMANESMVAYNAAKVDVDALMQYINAILQTAINGGDPTTVQDPGSCNGNCDGCTSCG